MYYRNEYDNDVYDDYEAYDAYMNYFDAPETDTAYQQDMSYAPRNPIRDYNRGYENDDRRRDNRNNEFDRRHENIAPLPGFTPEMINSGNFNLGAPPSHAPARPSASLLRVDPRSIRNCVGRFTYVWLDNGNEFWMYPLQVGRDSVSGLRWNRRFGWTYFGVSLNRIDSFMCV